jgi:hypothetical protein
VSDPNREDDPEYIARLVGSVVTVSVETVRLVEELRRRLRWRIGWRERLHFYEHVVMQDCI